MAPFMVWYEDDALVAEMPEFQSDAHRESWVRDFRVWLATNCIGSFETACKVASPPKYPYVEGNIKYSLSKSKVLSSLLDGWILIYRNDKNTELRVPGYLHSYEVKQILTDNNISEESKSGGNPYYLLPDKHFSYRPIHNILRIPAKKYIGSNGVVAVEAQNNLNTQPTNSTFNSPIAASSVGCEDW